MDTQVKYRLTGAIILVLIMVLIVPELLSGPGEGAQPTTVVSDEAPLRSYTIDLSGSAHSSAPQPAEALRPPPAADAAVAAPVAAAQKGEPGGAGAESEGPQKASEAEDVGPIEGEGDVLEAPVAIPRPQAAPAPRSAGSAPSSGWAVQVGSFANRENADKLARQLQGKGFRTAVSRSSGSRKLYRVRVGPAADRAGAQALAARLKAMGQSGSIVPHP